MSHRFGPVWGQQAWVSLAFGWHSLAQRLESRTSARLGGVGIRNAVYGALNSGGRIPSPQKTAALERLRPVA